MIPRSILVISHELPPFGGGAGRVLADLCTELHTRGVGVTVWTQKPPERKKELFAFTVRYFATGRTARFQTSARSIMLFTLKVLLASGSLRRDTPDLLFSNIGIPAGVAGGIIARRLKIPHIIWHHGADVHGNIPEGAGPLFRKLLRFAWKRSELLLFVSRGLRDMACGFGAVRERTALLHPFTGCSDSPAADAPKEKIFLFAGRLEKVKNPFLLLDAIDWLMASNRLPPDVKFRMVGDGALFSPVRSRIRRSRLANAVTIEGAQPGGSMIDIYGSAYALILTSVAEGFPLTVLEAGACGVPSLGPDALGVNEAITHDRTGIIFPQNDAEACGRAILGMANDQVKRDALGEAARESARGFTARRAADILLDCINRHIPGNDS